MNPFVLEGARRQLIELLKNKGITNEHVLSAFAKVERHRFIESFLWDKAYKDLALPIYCNQTISQPSTVAFQTQLLEATKGDKILEIGTGSGFQAAILSAIGAKVYSVERQLELYKKTKNLLEEIDYKIVVQYGDGFQGLPRYAPFDKIIVTCGAPNIPIALLQQLKTNGIMVIPVGEEVQTMKKIVKLDETHYKVTDYGNFTFVPMLEEIVKNTTQQ